MIQWLKRVVLWFCGGASPKPVAAPFVVPTIDFEEVPTILPEPPSRFVARFGKRFKKEGIVCGIHGGVVTIACMVKPGVIGEIVVRPTREVRLFMY